MRTIEAEHLGRRWRETDATRCTSVLRRVNAIGGVGSYRGLFCFAFSARLFNGLFCISIFGNWIRRSFRFGRGLRRFFVFDLQHQSAFAQLQSRFDSFGQPASNAWSRRQSLDNDFDVVAFGSVQINFAGERNRFSVDPSPCESAFQHVDEEIFVFAFLVANNGGQHGVLGVVLLHHDRADDLVARLGGDRLIALGAIPLSNACI